MLQLKFYERIFYNIEILIIKLLQKVPLTWHNIKK